MLTHSDINWRAQSERCRRWHFRATHTAPVSRAQLIPIRLAAASPRHFSSRALGSQALQLRLSYERFVFRDLSLLNWECQISYKHCKRQGCRPYLEHKSPFASVMERSYSFSTVRSVLVEPIFIYFFKNSTQNIRYFLSNFLSRRGWDSSFRFSFSISFSI